MSYAQRAFLNLIENSVRRWLDAYNNKNTIRGVPQTGTNNVLAVENGELEGDVIRDSTVDVNETPAGTTEAGKSLPVLASYKHERERDACAHTCAVSPFARFCAVQSAYALA